VGGAANGAAPVLPDIAVAAADHGLAAAGAVPALDLNWVDSRLVSCFLTFKLFALEQYLKSTRLL